MPGPTQLSQSIQPMEVRCRKCGSLLKVTVLPAMCPRCHTPVSVANPIPISQVVPTYPPARPQPAMVLPRWLWPAIAVAIGLLLIVFLIDDLRMRMHSNLTALNPPQAPVSQTPAPRPAAPAVVPPLPEAAPTPAPTTVEAPPAPIAPPPPPPPPPTHPFAALSAFHPFSTPPISASGLQDAQIVASIHNGVKFLEAQFSGSRLKDDGTGNNDRYEGLDTLCVYALMHAGLAIQDPDLTPQSTMASAMIDRVKSFPMNGSLATYSRSLRLQLLSLINRPEDHAAIEADFAWMLKSSLNGAYTYTYTAPAEHQSRPLDVWDNSNSQYGALGVWSAADAGFHPGGSYWQDVTQHWESTQQRAGGWTYSAGTPTPALSMTAAGVSILFTARDQTAADSGLSEARPTPLSPAILDGLDWLDEDDHAVTLSSEHPGYTLYGMERAGLASGYKFFGKHDWYLELAANSVTSQQKDGSWTGGDGALAETAFHLLFLSRGRHPVFLSKLQYDGDWAFRPRDVANLTKYASQQLEVPLNWQTVGLQRSALEWSDCPVLLLSGENPPTLSDADVAKLGEYIRAGGLLFTLSNRNSAAFTRFATELAGRLFPDLPFQPIPADHPLYNSIFALKPDPNFPLMGVSNGVRLLMVHSPSDLARQWNLRYEKTESGDLQIGTNIVLYGTGRRDLRHRSETVNVTPPSAPPLATVPIARISYSGNWDPEPGAWERMAKLMQTNTGLRCDIQPTAMSSLQASATPIAALTGTAAAQFSAVDLAALTQFVVDGGVLLIDSCGGNDAFAASVRSQFIDKLGESPDVIDGTSPLADITVDGVRDLSKPRLRNYAETRDLQAAGQLFIVHHGSGDVIFTKYDLTSGLLGTHTWGITGYSAAYAEAVVNDVVLWGVRQAGRILGK